VSFADPFCPVLREAARRAAAEAGVRCHDGGSLVVIEGPAFGTRAESMLYRSWGASVVGMTSLPEAKLAREAELCYALLASSTDYDAWKTDAEPVDAATVFRVLEENVAAGQAAVERLAPLLADLGPCECGVALDSALLTQPDEIPADVRQRLAPILARRLGGEV
jgi:5'-methylthioadenosine phosphorylase